MDSFLQWTSHGPRTSVKTFEADWRSPDRVILVQGHCCVSGELQRKGCVTTGSSLRLFARGLCSVRSRNASKVVSRGSFRESAGRCATLEDAFLSCSWRL